MRWFDVQHKTEDILNNLNKEGIKVNAVVTDCASQYEAARNSNKFSTVAEQAIHLVSFFNRSTFFLGRLRSEQLALYKSYVSFVLPNSTKIEEGNDEDFNNFPEILLTYISNNEWWNNLMQLKTLLELYMASLNKLQRDKGRLSDVLHSFGWVCQVIKNLSDGALRDYLITKLEKRCQLRSKLTRSRNIAAIDKSLKIYKQNIAIPVEENDEQTSLDEDTEEEQLISLSENDMDLENPGKQIQTNNAIVNQWVSLNEEKEVEDDLNESESLSELYFDEVEFHPVDDFTAKWKLADLFVDSLVQPAHINLLLGD
ncbi:8256_t:CDS:2 [Racocetra fulgida]|uniref:8256_t:CDS:1 n=2 Tax=Gigasporaceae TaxID=36753 RepID=A0A9N9APE1_9GLOM|nr:8256_t:CDS:2 [Racocetra fulgida]